MGQKILGVCEPSQTAGQTIDEILLTPELFAERSAMED